MRADCAIVTCILAAIRQEVKSNVDDMDFWKIISWTMRAGFVFFTAVSWIVFCKLWNSYSFNRQKARFECDFCSYTAVRYTFLVSTFAFMVLFIFAGFFNEKIREYLWAALA